MHEQRLTERLTKYWELVRKGHPLPEMEHLNTDPIRDLWPQCFTVSVGANGPNTYKCEYMGDPIAEAYGRDLTGQAVDNRMKHFPGAIVFRKLTDVEKRRVPLEDQGHFISEDGKMIKYRACFLPFGNEKRGLTHIIVGLSFRVFN